MRNRIETYRVVKVAPRFEVIEDNITDYDDAQKIWKDISWRDVDCAITRYTIEEDYA